MSDFKSRVYNSYVENHTNLLYGIRDIEHIEASFSLWDAYYLKLLPTDKNAKILDIGCGEGGFILYLNSRGYLNAKGIDVSKEQIELGNSLGIKAIEEVDLSSYLEDCNEEFDFIIARDVLEHFKRQEVFDICSLVFQALSKTGAFLIQVPNGEGLFYTSILYGDITHEWAYTESSLSQLFRTCGFGIVKVKEVAPYVHGIKSLLRFIGWKIIRFVHSFKKGVITGSPHGFFTPNIIALASK